MTDDSSPSDDPSTTNTESAMPALQSDGASAPIFPGGQQAAHLGDPAPITTAFVDAVAESPASILQDIMYPYTPQQRTRLVTDLLCHLQETHAKSGGVSDDVWHATYSDVSTADDRSLAHWWLAQVGPWLLARNDIIGPEMGTAPSADASASADSQYASALARFAETVPLDGEDITLAAQLYKRLSTADSADYGFLGWQEYAHTSSRDNSSSSTDA